MWYEHETKKMVLQKKKKNWCFDNGQAEFQKLGKRKAFQDAHPGNRTLVSTVGGYYDTTTPDALYT